MAELTARVVEVCRRVRPSFEVIFVEDGSVDDTWTEILEACATYPELRALRLRRNFGKAAALSAGFGCARGDVIITMDGDLQDDPDEIPRFLAEIERGYDVVSGWKRTRHDPVTKRAPSKVFNRVLRAVSGVNLHDFNCGFKAYRAAAAQNLRPFVYGELHRYLPALLGAQGFRVGEIEVRHHARRHGRSKYGAGRVVAGACDLLTFLLLTQFRYRPLHAFGLLALGAFTGAVFLGGGLAVAGRPLHGLGVGAVGVVLVAVLLGAGLVCELLVHATGPAETDARVAEAVLGDDPREVRPETRDSGEPLPTAHAGGRSRGQAVGSARTGMFG